jgi:4-nitrophenyl phosphatase
MHSFSNIRALIIDMDGVLWHGDKAIAGLTAFFQLLRDKQIRFILATNNASLMKRDGVFTPSQRSRHRGISGIVSEFKHSGQVE